MPGDGGLGLSYWLSLLAFVLAMLSKGSVAVLPLMLVGLTWWLRDRVTLGDLARVAPFFLIAVILTAVNIWFQAHLAEAPLHISFAQRLLGAGAVVWFYLSKALAPINLVFIYPHWDIRPGNLLWWPPLAAALIVSWVLVWRRISRPANVARPLLFAWGFFCLALLPVLGFVDVGFMQFSQVADHYQHIALIGVAALAAAGWSYWRQWGPPATRQAAWVVALGAIATLTLLTRLQSTLYTDAITLYQATLQKNPNCWVAHNNLGPLLADLGRPQEAIAHYKQALQIKPEYAEARYNLGNIFDKSGWPQDAIQQYQEALRIRPNYAEAHNNLGNALSKAGRLQEAIEHYEQALRIRPHYAQAHNNLAVLLATGNRTPEAIEHFQQALRLQPDNADTHHNLGVALVNAGQVPQAIEQFEEALRLDPNRIQTYGKLTRAYAQLQRPSEAIATAQKALELARSTGQTALAEQVENWLAKYRAQLGNPGDSSAPSEGHPAPAQ